MPLPARALHPEKRNESERELRSDSGLVEGVGILDAFFDIDQAGISIFCKNKILILLMLMSKSILTVLHMCPSSTPLHYKAPDAFQP